MPDQILVPTTEQVIDITGQYRPTGKQRTAHMTPEMFVLYGGAMGGGKSVWLVMELLQLCLDHPGNRVAIFRWENKTFKNTTLETMLMFYPKKLIKAHRKTDQVFELINGSQILYGGLKPTGNYNPIDRIKSMNLGAFAIDEASEVPEEFYIILTSRLRMENLPNIRYKGLVASNPEEGWVYNRFVTDPNKHPDHKFIQALPSDNPHNPADYEARLRRLFPKEWVKRYLDGEWGIITGEQKVFSYSFVKMAIERDIGTLGPCRLAADVGTGTGNDPTIVIGRWGNTFRILYKSIFRDTAESADDIAELIDKHQPFRVDIDGVGAGVGVCDNMDRMGYEFHRYNAGNTANEPEKFADKRAEDHWRLRMGLEQEEFDLPDDEELRAELMAPRYSTDTGKVRIESKKQMRSRGIKSPNMTDGIIMTLTDDPEEEATQVGRVLTKTKSVLGVRKSRYEKAMEKYRKAA